MEKERQSLYIEPLAIRDILFEVLERFDPKTLQEHPIQVDIPDYIVGKANAQYLRQVLRNLLSNAFKYVPAGTSIIVSAALFGMVVHPRHASPEICIKVKDFGSGIKADEIPLLFQQFVRLHREQTSRVGGSGLGLFLSKQFVESMGGRIWVESEGIEGQGSSFCFTIPCVIHPNVKFQTSPSDFVKFGSSMVIE
jgi:signal transduction histidine kinase